MPKKPALFLLQRVEPILHSWHTFLDPRSLLLRRIRSITQQRSAFPILGNDLTALKRRLAARDTERKDEEQSADSEGKDPLQLQDRKLGQELAHSGRCIR